MVDHRSFFSLNKQLDWDRGESRNLTFSDQGFQVIQTEKYAMEKTIDGQYINEINEIRAVSISADGRLSFLDEDARVWYFDYRNQFIEPSLLTGRGLVEKTSLLMPFEDVCMIGTSDADDDPLMNVSTLNGQIVWARSTLDDGTRIRPLTMDGKADRELYVLTPLADEVLEGGELPAGTEVAIVRFDGAGKEKERFTHELMTLDTKRRLTHLKERYTLSVSTDGDVLMYDREKRCFLLWRNKDNQWITWSVHHAMVPSDAVIRSDGKIFLSDGRTSRATGTREEERFIYEWDQETGRLTPLMAARGRYDRLFIDERDRIYAWNDAMQKLAIFKLIPRTKELEETGELKGIYTYGPFDSFEEKNTWHKIQLSCRIPDESQIRIYVYAADRLEYLDGGNLVLLNQRFLMDQPLAAFPWQGPIVNPAEALFGELQGRYLFVRIELLGSDRASPFIERIRVYFPRETYLNYLPSIYQEDEGSRVFLERYLSLFATFMDNVTEEIEAVPQLYELTSTSEEFLQWIGSWMGIKEVKRWDQDRLRTLLLEAPVLFKRRGTRDVLERLLEIYLGEKPLMLEQFETTIHIQDSGLKRVFDQLYGTDPYSFFVFIRSELIEDEEVRSFVEQLVEDEKPAYTKGLVVSLDPWMYLDMHSYLGVNTYLSELSLLRLNQRSVIPADTVLIDVERSKRMSIHTRMDVDSSLE